MKKQFATSDFRQIRTVQQHDGFNSRAELFGVELLIEIAFDISRCGVCASRLFSSWEIDAAHV